MPDSTGPHRVLVPVERVERWVENFGGRHGETVLTVVDGALDGEASDGSRFTARLPFDASYDGSPDAAALTGALRPPDRWGVLLVRKGGFGVALLHGSVIAESKIGRRHVQGRTAAGGQSQQRFARRRVNQARQAFEAAADHAARILETRPLVVVTGGDRTAVEEVLADPRLRHVSVTEPWLDVPDPRREILERAVRDACSVRFEVLNAAPWSP